MHINFKTGTREKVIEFRIVAEPVHNGDGYGPGHDWGNGDGTGHGAGWGEGFGSGSGP